MENFNINEVDFFNLDIEKYLNWLLEKYDLYSEIYEIPYLDEQIIRLHARKYFINSHYKATRLTNAPDWIINEFNARIEVKEIERNKFESVSISELIFFESLHHKSPRNEQNKYGFFSKDELKRISIDNSNLKMWFDTHKESYFFDLIDDINKRQTSTPLVGNAFYQKELKNIIENSDFDYLPKILDDQFIYNLDDSTNARTFAIEIDKIRIAIYLTEKIEGKAQPSPPTKPLNWTGQINSLVTIFSELLTADLIKNERGTKENIKRLILNNFTNSKNSEISKNTIDEIFKPNNLKIDKVTAELLKPLLSHLAKK